MYAPDFEEPTGSGFDIINDKNARWAMLAHARNAALFAGCIFIYRVYGDQFSI